MYLRTNRATDHKTRTITNRNKSKETPFKIYYALNETNIAMTSEELLFLKLIKSGRRIWRDAL